MEDSTESKAAQTMGDLIDAIYLLDVYAALPESKRVILKAIIKCILAAMRIQDRIDRRLK